MATTALFAEIIVIGLQVEAWLTLLVLGLFDTEWVQTAQLERWVALITILVVATAYMLGVMMDRIADNVFLASRTLVGRLGLGSQGDPREFGRRRLIVMDASEGLGKFLDYQRSRFRIARATAVNAALSLPGGALLLRDQDPTAGLAWFLAIAMLTLIGVSAYSAVAIGRAYTGALAAAYAIVKDNKAIANRRDAAPPAPRG